MSNVLYGARGSGSAIVEMACAEVGVAVEIHDLDLRADEQRGDAYAAINPHAKLPTLDLGGERLTETAAILLTLDERNPSAGLLPPSGSRARARASRLLLFMATELYPIIEIVDYPERFSPEPATLEAVRERAKHIWRSRWATVEAAVAGPYSLEHGFSAVDLYAAVLSRWDMSAQWRAENLPRVDALAAAVAKRPAVAPVWARHFG